MPLGRRYVVDLTLTCRRRAWSAGRSYINILRVLFKCLWDTTAFYLIKFLAPELSILHNNTRAIAMRGERGERSGGGEEGAE